jgi:hypothetical protein
MVCPVSDQKYWTVQVLVQGSKQWQARGARQAQSRPGSGGSQIIQQLLVLRQGTDLI